MSERGAARAIVACICVEDCVVYERDDIQATLKRHAQHVADVIGKEQVWETLETLAR